MEESQILDNKQDLFIVYRYNIHNPNTTKFIMGIYSTLEEAITRQKSLCPNYNKVLVVTTHIPPIFGCSTIRIKELVHR